MEKPLSLYELNTLVREVIETSFDRLYWVEAELSEVREVRGHLFLELIEKDEWGNIPVAKASAKCWKSVWNTLGPMFERITGQPLLPGQKVLLQVSASFHEAYGFSWIVNGIDPRFTLGDMAKKRQEIIDKLKAQGVFHLQHDLPLPFLPQRVAVVSSEQAAGYGDFCNELLNNDYGLAFSVELFPAVMQGNEVEQSIIHALNIIYSRLDEFDVVAIIRGGGGTSDFSGFDALLLAENVVNFPLPVITGIGHRRDECVLDMVACRSLQTPTAVARFLVNAVLDVQQRIFDAERRITETARVLLATESIRLERLSASLALQCGGVLSKHENKVERLLHRIQTAVERRVGKERSALENWLPAMYQSVKQQCRFEGQHLVLLEQRIEALNPELLLKRGYSITFYKGHILRNISTLQDGDEIETRMYDGTVKSIVKR